MNGRIAFGVGPRRPLEIDEFPVVDPEPDQIVVRVLAAGVCGSDVHIWRGELPFPTALPSPPGHEMIGEVHELGSDRRRDSLGRKLEVGDRVTYAYFHPCGNCTACAAGSPACPNRYAERAALTVHDVPHFHGAFADFYYIRGGQWIFKVPPGLAPEMAVPANCAVSQALYGLHRAQLRLGDVVVVQGLGGLGMYATALAKDSGAGFVIGVDGATERLALACRFGADAVLDIRELDTPEARAAAVERLTDGAGADAVIEMAGVPEVVPEGIRYLRPGGRYVLIGNVMANATVEIVPQAIVRSARELIGVVTYPQWVLPRAVEWIYRRSTVYPFEQLVSRTYPLEQINDALEASDWGSSRVQPGRAVVSMTK
jgi:threonine dehydrogenase-like Zn-dependent dehydrogenase